MTYRTFNWCWAALLFLSATPALGVEVRDVRVWAGPDSTRVVFDLSASAAHSVLVLKNPDRVVLDIDGAKWRAGAHAPEGGAGAVKQVRMARRSSGELRIVLDLAHAVQAKSFLAAPNNRYGYRLVIVLDHNLHALTHLLQGGSEVLRHLRFAHVDLRH